MVDTTTTGSPVGPAGSGGSGGSGSTKPYLIRAIYEWCNDNGYTPYVAVVVNEHTQVPREHIKEGEIVLNVSPMATAKLKFGNEWLEFSARFGGMAREIWVPIGQIGAIYAKETGHGMGFEIEPLIPQASAAGTEPAKPVAKTSLAAVRGSPSPDEAAADPGLNDSIAEFNTTALELEKFRTGGDREISPIEPAVPSATKRPKLTVVK